MSVQRMRLAATARNIANANTTRSIDGQPYKREAVIVRAVENRQFNDELQDQLFLSRTSGTHGSNLNNGAAETSKNALHAVTAVDNSPPRLVHDPSHPDADEEGYVKMPNINIITEMVEMISAQRAFEANASVIESVKNIARDSLDI